MAGKAICILAVCLVYVCAQVSATVITSSNTCDCFRCGPIGLAGNSVSESDICGSYRADGCPNGFLECLTGKVKSRCTAVFTNCCNFIKDCYAGCLFSRPRCDADYRTCINKSSVPRICKRNLVATQVDQVPRSPTCARYGVA